MGAYKRCLDPGMSHLHIIKKELADIVYQAGQADYATQLTGYTSHIQSYQQNSDQALHIAVSQPYTLPTLGNSLLVITPMIAVCKYQLCSFKINIVNPDIMKNGKVCIDNIPDFAHVCLQDDDSHIIHNQDHLTLAELPRLAIRLDSNVHIEEDSYFLNLSFINQEQKIIHQQSQGFIVHQVACQPILKTSILNNQSSYSYLDQVEIFIQADLPASDNSEVLTLIIDGIPSQVQTNIGKRHAETDTLFITLSKTQGYQGILLCLNQITTDLKKLSIQAKSTLPRKHSVAYSKTIILPIHVRLPDTANHIRLQAQANSVSEGEPLPISIILENLAWYDVIEDIVLSQLPDVAHLSYINNQQEIIYLDATKQKDKQGNWHLTTEMLNGLTMHMPIDYVSNSKQHAHVACQITHIGNPEPIIKYAHFSYDILSTAKIPIVNVSESSVKVNQDTTIEIQVEAQTTGKHHTEIISKIHITFLNQDNFIVEDAYFEPDHNTWILDVKDKAQAVLQHQVFIRSTDPTFYGSVTAYIDVVSLDKRNPQTSSISDHAAKVQIEIKALPAAIPELTVTPICVDANSHLQDIPYHIQTHDKQSVNKKVLSVQALNIDIDVNTQVLNTHDKLHFSLLDPNKTLPNGMHYAMSQTDDSEQKVVDDLSACQNLTENTLKSLMLLFPQSYITTQNNPCQLQILAKTTNQLSLKTAQCVVDLPIQIAPVATPPKLTIHTSSDNIHQTDYFELHIQLDSLPMSYQTVTQIELLLPNGMITEDAQQKTYDYLASPDACHDDYQLWQLMLDEGTIGPRQITLKISVETSCLADTFLFVRALMTLTDNSIQSDPKKLLCWSHWQEKTIHIKPAKPHEPNYMSKTHVYVENHTGINDAPPPLLIGREIFEVYDIDFTLTVSNEHECVSFNILVPPSCHTDKIKLAFIHHHAVDIINPDRLLTPSDIKQIKLLTPTHFSSHMPIGIDIIPMVTHQLSHSSIIFPKQTLSVLIQPKIENKKQAPQEKKTLVQSPNTFNFTYNIKTAYPAKQVNVIEEDAVKDLSPPQQTGISPDKAKDIKPVKQNKDNTYFTLDIYHQLIRSNHYLDLANYLPPKIEKVSSLTVDLPAPQLEIIDTQQQTTSISSVDDKEKIRYSPDPMAIQPVLVLFDRPLKDHTTLSDIYMVLANNKVEYMTQTYAAYVLDLGRSSLFQSDTLESSHDKIEETLSHYLADDNYVIIVPNDLMFDRDIEAFYIDPTLTNNRDYYFSLVIDLKMIYPDIHWHPSTDTIQAEQLDSTPNGSWEELLDRGFNLTHPGLHIDLNEYIQALPMPASINSYSICLPEGAQICERGLPALKDDIYYLDAAQGMLSTLTIDFSACQIPAYTLVLSIGLIPEDGGILDLYWLEPISIHCDLSTIPLAHKASAQANLCKVSADLTCFISTKTIDIEEIDEYTDTTLVDDLDDLLSDFNFDLTTNHGSKPDETLEHEQQTSQTQHTLPENKHSRSESSQLATDGTTEHGQTTHIEHTPEKSSPLASNPQPSHSHQNHKVVTQTFTLSANHEVSSDDNTAKDEHNNWLTIQTSTNINNADNETAADWVQIASQDNNEDHDDDIFLDPAPNYRKKNDPPPDQPSTKLSDDKSY